VERKRGWSKSKSFELVIGKGFSQVLRQTSMHFPGQLNQYEYFVYYISLIYSYILAFFRSFAFCAAGGRKLGFSLPSFRLLL